MARYQREVKISADEVATDTWLQATFQDAIPVEYFSEKYNVKIDPVKYAEIMKRKAVVPPSPFGGGQPKEEDGPQDDDAIKNLVHSLLKGDVAGTLKMHAEIQKLYEHKHDY